MSQVPVKWTAQSFLKDRQTTLHKIPVVPLSALREVVEGLREKQKGSHGQETLDEKLAYWQALDDLLASLEEKEA